MFCKQIGLFSIKSSNDLVMSCISYGDLMLVSEQAASIVNADVLSRSDTHTADATEPHHLCFTAKILLDQHRCWFLTNSHVYESATCGIPNVLCTFYGMVCSGRNKQRKNTANSSTYFVLATNKSFWRSANDSLTKPFQAQMSFSCSRDVAEWWRWTRAKTAKQNFPTKCAFEVATFCYKLSHCSCFFNAPAWHLKAWPLTRRLGLQSDTSKHYTSQQSR